MNRYLLIFTALFLGCSSGQKEVLKQANQNPSPMVENIRAHERIENMDVPGLSFFLETVLSKPVEVYIPVPAQNKQRLGLLIHFHGSSFVPKFAVYKSEHPVILAVINLGSGSSVYERPFLSKTVFSGLIESIKHSVSENMGREIQIYHKSHFPYQRQG